MLIMFAAGVGLVAARVWLGPGRALGAVAFFIAMRGLLALGVHDSLGQSLPHFPLYIAEALVVEGAALVVSPKRRPLLFGAVAGALIGTVGLAAEWGWSHLWMPIPWPDEILPETIALGFAMAVAASFLGAWVGARLGSEHVAYSRPLRWAALTAGIAAFAMLAFPLALHNPDGLSARVALRDVTSGPQRTAMATVTMRPRDAAEHAKWLTATAWQGGGLVVDHLRKVSPGVYETTRPIPLHGSWKANIRLHKGSALLALPLYAPADAAIPVARIAAPRRFERPFVSDKKLLQREAKTRDASITYGAYAAVLACTLLLLALLTWALHRVGATARTRRGPLPPPTPDGFEPAAQPSSNGAGVPDYAAR
jgi:hypothetical protein